MWVLLERFMLKSMSDKKYFPDYDGLVQERCNTIYIFLALNHRYETCGCAAIQSEGMIGFFIKQYWF